MNLDAFKAAQKLVWVRHTVFRPHRGDDGNLIADGLLKLELDTWLPEPGYTDHHISSEGVGIAVTDPTCLDDLHDAIRAWCKRFLDRDDIHFTSGDDQ